MRSISQLVDLTGRKALVTGGAGHLGMAAAETLMELGADVALLDIEPSACEKKVAELSLMRLQGRAIPLACDLTDERACRKTIRDGIDKLRGLDILVHSAAYVGTTSIPGWAVPFEQQTIEAWDKALRVNLSSAFVMAQEAKPALATSGRGAIIFFLSMYAVVGPDMTLYNGTNMANPVGYGVSKGGLLQMTRYLATIFAPLIRVNAISPGGVWRGQPDEFRRRYIARTPLRRMAIEEDLKGAVAYLASDLSSYVTGQNLVVDGGWTAW